MFGNITNFLKKFSKKNEKVATNSREAAKERLHLVLMQDRANVSADFLELMKQEIIEVIKKYIEVDEGAIDVRLTNKDNEDGTNGAPALYANIPILNIKNEAKKVETKDDKKKEKNKEEKNKNEKTEIEEKEKEVSNERIAKIIIDGKIDKLEKNPKKEEKKEKIEEVGMDNQEESESQIPEKKEEDTKEELKSEN